MKHFYPLFIIFNLVGHSLFAAQKNLPADSLKRLIFPVLKHSSTPIDTLTIGRINKLADEYFESNPDSTTYYGNLEIKLSTKINYRKGIAEGYTQVAAVNTFQGDYELSAKNYAIALNIYRQIHNNYGISESYIGLGRVQDYLGHYDNAIRLLDTALELRIRLKNEIKIAECYNIMGITFDNEGEFANALDCYFKSLIIDIKNQENLGAADCYNNIGCIMQKMELYPKAISYFNKALNIWQHNDDKQGISTAYQNIGEVLIFQKKYSEAIGYLNKASDIFHNLNDREGISLVYYDLGLYNYYTRHPGTAIRYLNLSLQFAHQYKIKYNKAYAYQGLALVYNLQKDYKKAYTYAIKAQQTANTLQSLNTRVDATLQVSKALAGLKRFDEAYKQHQLYANLKDSLINNESVQKLISYNLEIDFLRKQKEIVEQKRLTENVYQQKITRQKRVNLIYVIIIIVMAALALVYYNEKRKQQKINVLLAQKNKEIIAHQDNLNLQAIKLNELNALKNRLIGVLAHDLRAPISTLRGLFNLMTDNAISREEFVEMIPKVFNKLEHTSDFLDTLLFWINSQVDSTKNTIKIFSLDQLVNLELEHLDDQLKQKNLSAINNVPVATNAYADPNSVRIVIHNFLTNAIKFSNRGGSIKISSYRPDKQSIILNVKDHGIGMTEEYVDNLFKSQVVSHTGTENEIGTGMGLLFCKDLIANQNGKIWAKSRLGAGSELGFVLPVGANE